MALIVCNCHMDSSHTTKQFLQPKGAVKTVKSESCLKLLAQFMTKFCTFLLSKCFLPDQLICDIALSQL